ncbi:hypothetical protein [Lentzea nigeriaca]|nr:hypothetical protein [Lentzea nigeriaca]MBM7858158.1 hypothetical protein [Lentzea nigeriaca]
MNTPRLVVLAAACRQFDPGQFTEHQFKNGYAVHSGGLPRRAGGL